MLKTIVSESKLVLLASLGKIVKKKEKKIHRVDAVSYTHLTLPTKIGV